MNNERIILKMRKTRIVATLGPSTDSTEMMKELILAGVNVARFNFSHGDHAEQKAKSDKMRQVSEELKMPVALMLDTKGPEIRTKTFKNGEVELIRGNKFTLTIRDIEGDETECAVTYDGFIKDLKVGSRVMLDDGLIELIVDELTETDAICTVVNSGPLKNNKGINLPDVDVNLPTLTDKDISDIKFAITENFHFIAASFIRNAQDVKEIRKLLKTNGGEHIQIIAKIENRQGVDNAASIIEEADGIMVARGDLGIEIPAEEVPIVQKSLIDQCNRAGKPVITATQMLESMTGKPRPTRAEASDVANAIFDGTDAIMLSGETANGEYPIEAVKVMDKIALKVEESIEYHLSMNDEPDKCHMAIHNAIGYATSSITQNINASHIFTFSVSGFTARNVSKFRPFAPIVAITPSEVTYHQLSLVWGVVPLMVPAMDDTIELYRKAIEVAQKEIDLPDGSSIVIASGMPLNTPKTTNNIRIHVVGNEF